jgi:hypothetical protein
MHIVPVVPCSHEQVHAVQRSRSWRPVPKCSHAYTVTCLQEGGEPLDCSGLLTANEVTSEGEAM